MIILFLILIVLTLLSNNLELISLVTIIVFLIRGFQSYRKNHLISYVDIWNLGFIYIVISEVLLDKEYLLAYGLDGVRFVFISNILINIGFLIQTSRKNLLNNTKDISLYNININGFWFFIIFILIAVFYFFLRLDEIILAINYGRASALGDAKGGANLFGFLISALGYAIPIITTFFFRYYFRYKYKILYIIVIALVLAPQILWGTRFVLLFSLVTPFIILFENKKIRIKTILYLLIGFLSIIYINQFVRSNRDRVEKD